MPTLTFTNADIVVTFSNWEPDPVVDPPRIGVGNPPHTYIPYNLVDNGFGDININGIADDTGVSDPIVATTDHQYTKIGSLAVAYANRIPSTARITQLVQRIDVSCNCQSTVTGSSSGSGRIDIDLPSEFETEPPAIHFAQNDATMPVSLLKIASYTAPETNRTTSFTGFAAGYVTRTYLINNHASTQVRLYVEWISASGSGGTGTSVINFSLSNTHYSVTVTYDVPPTQWTLSQSTVPVEPEDPGPPVVPGTTVTITSPEPESEDSLDMEQITSVTIRYIDGTTIPAPNFIAFSPFLFTFTMPEFDPTQPILVIDVESTQFSGSLELGMLVAINFLSASGLYQLDFDATHDTLYIEEDLPNTIDVKIPNPTIKTGFIDG